MSVLLGGFLDNVKVIGLKIQSTNSMWPLLQKDGLGLQYSCLLVLWNYMIGYNPLTLAPSIVKYFSLVRSAI